MVDSLPEFGASVRVDTLPEPLDRPAPDYPEWARRDRLTGTALVRGLVGRDGKVHDVVLIQSAGLQRDSGGDRVNASVARLDSVALATVRTWRFEPARADGEAVAVWVVFPVTFPPR
jgi:protein TonB